MVALRKESVDRNEPEKTITPKAYKSLSARRAWIEMSTWQIPFSASQSLSARRAWIEMYAEGGLRRLDVGRSPQGERG